MNANKIGFGFLSLLTDVEKTMNSELAKIPSSERKNYDEAVKIVKTEIMNGKRNVNDHLRKNGNKN